MKLHQIQIQNQTGLGPRRLQHRLGKLEGVHKSIRFRFEIGLPSHLARRFGHNFVYFHSMFTPTSRQKDTNPDDTCHGCHHQGCLHHVLRQKVQRSKPSMPKSSKKKEPTAPRPPNLPGSEPDDEEDGNFLAATSKKMDTDPRAHLAP